MPYRKFAVLTLAIISVIAAAFVVMSAYAEVSNKGPENESLPLRRNSDGRFVVQSQAREMGALPATQKHSYTVDGLGSGIVEFARSLPMHRGAFPPSTRPGQMASGNVTVTSDLAKATVNASIPNYKVGTIASLRTGWNVPIEDGKGVVTTILVSRVSASTADQAKAIVEESLKRGWKAGQPKLVRAIYNVPLLDSNRATITFVNVNGRSGDIIRGPSTILSVTSEQAKIIVSNAAKQFKVGDVKDRGSVWTVSIKYNDKVLMAVILGKLNTPTSDDALKVVQDSLSKGWTLGEPTLVRYIYNVPITAAGNTIGSVAVDGRSGEIITGPLGLRR